MTEARNTAVLEPPSTSPQPDPPPTPTTSDRLEIDEADWSDAPAVIEIISSSAEWYEPFLDPDDLDEHYVDEEWARENFERREFFVGRLEDEVAGTVSLQEVGSDHLYLGYVYLHTDHVGNGLGGKLLDFARDELRRRERSSMVLIAHPEAVWARKAYLRYGFEIIAESKEEVLSWHDGWLEPYYEEGFQLYEFRL